MNPNIPGSGHYFGGYPYPVLPGMVTPVAWPPFASSAPMPLEYPPELMMGLNPYHPYSPYNPSNPMLLCQTNNYYGSSFSCQAPFPPLPSVLDPLPSTTPRNLGRQTRDPVPFKSQAHKKVP
jgi:hypothetical protein